VAAGRIEVGPDSPSIRLAGFLATTVALDEKSRPTNRKLVKRLSMNRRVVYDMYLFIRTLA
jgi:hypothetical protein